MNCFISIHCVAIVLAFCGVAQSLFAALPIEESGKLRHFVSTTKTMRDQVGQLVDVLKRAADSGDYDIVELAINNPDYMTHSSGMFFLKGSKIPVETKRRILLSALLNPSIWPPQEPTDEEVKERDGSTRAGYWNFQDLMCEALSAAFDAKIDSKAFGGFWSKEDRLELAKKLGGHEDTGALGSPDGARRVGPRNERSVGVHGKEDSGATSNAAFTRKPAETASLLSGWALWAGIAAAVAAAVGWLLLRRNGGGGKG